MSRGEIISEHLRWARRQGWSPQRVVESVGLKVHGEGRVGWDDAFDAVAWAIQAMEDEQKVTIAS